MKKNQLSYREMSKIIGKRLLTVIEKHELDMDQVINHFSVFLAQYVMKNSADRLIDSLNFVHSFSRYIMALQIDEANAKRINL